MIQKKRNISIEQFHKQIKRRKYEYKSSKYVGVTIKDPLSIKPWLAQLYFNNKRNYLGYFKTEVEAAKFVNFVCKKESIKIKNPELSDEETETFIWPLPRSKKVKFSKYVGVSISDRKTAKNPWIAKISINGKQQYLGSFKTEIEAAKCVNFVCKKQDMKLKNPELSDEEENFTWSLPTKEKSSKYVGVTIKDPLSIKPWLARLRIDGKVKHLGVFQTEIEAAKCVNFACKKYDMELKNPELSDEEENFTWSLPKKRLPAKKKSSKYVGVTKNNDKRSRRPWRAKVFIDGIQKYLGCFKTEIEAAKCVNFAMSIVLSHKRGMMLEKSRKH